MSLNIVNLGSQIILDVFGNQIQAVVDYMFEYEMVSFKSLTEMVNLNVPQSEKSELIFNALITLLKFDLIKPSVNSSKVVMYSLKTENILRILRYSRFAFLIRLKYGDEVEKIIRFLLNSGAKMASTVVLSISESVNPENFKENLVKFRDKFALLVANEYLIRIDLNSASLYKFEYQKAEKHSFRMPVLDLNNLVSQDIIGDKGVFWFINADKFEKDYIDYIICKEIYLTRGEVYSKIVKLFLESTRTYCSEWYLESNPITTNELYDLASRKEFSYSSMSIFNYLKIFAKEDNAIIRQIDDCFHDTFVFDMFTMLKKFAYDIVEKFLTNKYGRSCSRIFRLVKNKKYIEPKFIQRFAMISVQDCKSIIYLLLQENFLKLKQFKKPNSNVTFELLYIDLYSVVRNLLEHCYKTTYNLYIRKSFEYGVYQELNYINCSNEISKRKKQLLLKRNTTESNIKKLTIKILDMDRSIFLLSTFLKFECMK